MDHRGELSFEVLGEAAETGGSLFHASEPWIDVGEDGVVCVCG